MPPRRAKQEVRIMVDETVDAEILPVDDAMPPLDVIQPYDGINDFMSFRSASYNDLGMASVAIDGVMIFGSW